MTVIQSITLGLVQGIAEFLPISSSGHLVLFKDLLGLSEVPLLFDIVLHLATLLAVLIVLRKRVVSALAAFFRWIARRTRPEDAENLAMIPPFLVATLITAVMGFGISRFLPVEGSRLVAIELLVTAAVLAATAFLRPGTRGYGELRLRDGLATGIAQGLGVFSGISRSGFTISAGLASGMRRETAGEFSFLLSIPAILGAFLVELKDAADLASKVEFLPLALSALVAFASGVLALGLLLRLVRGGKLAWFAVYLVPVGLAALFLA